MNLSLEGKIALVGGSTQGIGWAIAQEFSGMGASCILLSRNENALKERLSVLRADRGQNHDYAVADYSDTDQLRSVVEELAAERTIHILVNNTGGPPPGPITEASETAFLDAFRQHLIANHVIVKALLPGMRLAGYGRIINIVSTSVRIPIVNLGVSNTTRAAVAGWAKTMANELGPDQITVNNILPGYTSTQRLSGLIRNTAQRLSITEEEAIANLLEKIPARRFGRPEEIAALAAFLASPAAAFINGTSIPVDGGSTGTL